MSEEAATNTSLPPSDPRAASVYQRVSKATQEAGPVARERTVGLAGALLWLIDMAEAIAKEEGDGG